jgi:Thioredoxin-like
VNKPLNLTMSCSYIAALATRLVLVCCLMAIIGCGESKSKSKSVSPKFQVADDSGKTKSEDDAVASSSTISDVTGVEANSNSADKQNPNPKAESKSSGLSNLVEGAKANEPLKTDASPSISSNLPSATPSIIPATKDATSPPVTQANAPSSTPQVGLGGGRGATGGTANLQVPEKGKQALTRFLTQLAGLQDSLAREDRGSKEDYINIEKARELTAERLFADETLTEEERVGVTQIRLDSLSQQLALEVPDAEKRINDLCIEMKEHPVKGVSIVAKIFLVGASYNKIIKKETTDLTQFSTDMQDLIVSNPDSTMVFQATQNLSAGLFMEGYRDEAIKVLRLITTTFTGSTNPELVKRALEEKDHLQLAEMGFDIQMRELSEEKSGAADKLFNIATDVLAKNRLSILLYSEFLVAGKLLETRHEYDTARKLYDLIDTTAKDQPNKQLTREAQVLTENARKRLALVGQPFTVEGKTMDLTDFDWNPYKGKVVLVAFWSTQDQSTMEMLTRINQFINLNKGSSFDFVAINIDEDREALRKMFAGGIQRPSWANTISSDPQRVGFNSPMAEKCGVDRLPFTLLVNQAGNVEHIQVYDRDLEKMVSKLLGFEVQSVFNKLASPATLPKAPQQ